MLLTVRWLMTLGLAMYGIATQAQSSFNESARLTQEAQNQFVVHAIQLLSPGVYEGTQLIQSKPAACAVRVEYIPAQSTSVGASPYYYAVSINSIGPTSHPTSLAFGISDAWNSQALKTVSKGSLAEIQILQPLNPVDQPESDPSEIIQLSMDLSSKWIRIESRPAGLLGFFQRKQIATCQINL